MKPLLSDFERAAFGLPLLNATALVEGKLLLLCCLGLALTLSLVSQRWPPTSRAINFLLPSVWRHALASHWLGGNAVVIRLATKLLVFTPPPSPPILMLQERPNLCPDAEPLLIRGFHRTERGNLCSDAAFFAALFVDRNLAHWSNLSLCVTVLARGRAPPTTTPACELFPEGVPLLGGPVRLSLGIFIVPARAVIRCRFHSRKSEGEPLLAHY
ncbi:hypothetical protein MIND_00657300 [Mycena indigotica]|uniref:Uncharacterized protein n=1 Tax=Mycena indigotica TaxID=2126181 RepID=A0A8H6W0G2_9AGAR|nr:uncharacterized protein MIND_00657300 [Mycena indigotica]KAF7300944.1 hypothetical protein MIND_00657300 [Mycena indigotica]